MWPMEFWMAEYFCNWLSCVQGDMTLALLPQPLLRLLLHRQQGIYVKEIPYNFVELIQSVPVIFNIPRSKEKFVTPSVCLLEWGVRWRMQMRECAGSAQLGENKYYVISHSRHFVNMSSLSLYLLRYSSCQGNTDYKSFCISTNNTVGTQPECNHRTMARGDLQPSV